MNLRNTSRAESCLLSREAGRERKEKTGRDEKVKTKKMGEKGQSDQAEECEAALSFPLPLNHLQCFSFTQTVLSCVPLLPPSIQIWNNSCGTGHDIRQGGASRLNFRVSFLPWDKRHAMSSIPVVSSPIPNKRSFSSRSQFWLGVNNERKQEDRSERGMTANWRDYRDGTETKLLLPDETLPQFAKEQKTHYFLESIPLGCLLFLYAPLVLEIRICR